MCWPGRRNALRRGRTKELDQKGGQYAIRSCSLNPNRHLSMKPGQAQDDPVWGAENKKRAELARTKRCAQVQQVALAHGPKSVRSFASMFRGTQADIEQIRYQAPLPESADELCEVARRLGVPESGILLGADATETLLKDLSVKGR